MRVRRPSEAAIGEGTSKGAVPSDAPAHGAAVAGLAVGAAALATYAATLAPSVLADDSAELTTAVHVLGLPHPTGYPLYLLVGKLFDLIPLSTPPVRIGLLSALSGAAAAGVIAAVTARLLRSTAAGILAGVVVAFNGVFWSQSTEVEVYAFNALLIALCLAFFARWYERRNARDLLWIALFAGLAVAHHRSSAFLTGPMLVTALVVERPPLKRLLSLVAVVVGPFLLYLYVPIRAAAHPPVMWTGVDTWKGFVSYVSGSNYREYVLGRSLPEVLSTAVGFARTALTELTPGGLILVPIGLAALLKRRPLFAAPLTAGVALQVLWAFSYRVEDYRVFLIPAVLAAAVCAGQGLLTLSGAFLGLMRRKTPAAAAAFSAAVIVILASSLFLNNGSRSGHRGEWKDSDRGRMTLAQLPPGAILVSNLDYGSFLPMYLQTVEGFRRDVIATDSCHLYEPWIDDPIYREIGAVQSRWRVIGGPDPEARSRDALLFCSSLGPALGWSRPIYCQALVSRAPQEAPAVSLGSDLFRIAAARPPPAEVPFDALPVAEYEGGISLLGAALHPGVLRPREVFRLTLLWRCARAVQEAPFVLVTIAHDDGSGRLVQPDGMLTRYADWFVGGLSPLPANGPGLAYRQEIVGIVPTEAPEGRWIIRAGLGRDAKSGVTVEEIGEFRVVQP